MIFKVNLLNSIRYSDWAKDITVYTTSGCPKCKILKKWLKSKKIDFTEMSLEDEEVITNLIMRNFVILSAPVLEVKGEVFTEEQIFAGHQLLSDRLPKNLR